jgi:hypothetical protein
MASSREQNPMKLLLESIQKYQHCTQFRYFVFNLVAESGTIQPVCAYRRLLADCLGNALCAPCSEATFEVPLWPRISPTIAGIYDSIRIPVPPPSLCTVAPHVPQLCCPISGGYRTSNAACFRALASGAGDALPESPERPA